MDDLLFLSGIKPAVAEKKRVTAGWSLVVGSNGNRERVGNAVFIQHDAAFVFASFLIAAKPRESSGVCPEYFYRWLSSELVQAYLSASAEGTTGLNNLSHSFFKAMTIPFPRPDEQSAIAQLLDAVDKTLESTRGAVERARVFRQALVQRLFMEGTRGEPQKKTAIGFVPRSWDVACAKSVIRVFQYGLSLPMAQTGRIPILRMGNIQDGGVVLNELKYVTLPDAVLAPYLIRRGDVLFNRTNSQEWVGKVGLYRDDTPAVFASYLIRLLPDLAKVTGTYLAHVLGSYPTQCRIKRFATPGVQQVNINATNLGKVLIPIPAGGHGLAQQAEIAEILEAADHEIRSKEPVLACLETLKRSLTHDLLTGAVRVLRAANPNAVV